MPKTNIKTKKSKTELPQKRGEEEKLFSSPAESRNGGTKVKKSAKKNVSSFVSSPTRRTESSSPADLLVKKRTESSSPIKDEEEGLSSSPADLLVKKRTESSSPLKSPLSAHKEETQKKAKEEKQTEKQTKYLKGLGRRKTSTARIRLFNEEGGIFSVNEKPLEKYFPTLELQKTVLSPFEKMSCLGQFNVKVLVNGGGLNSQAEAIRNGIAKALVLFNPEFRKRLKKAGYLTRDSRMRERKKFGLKRARRAPQWQKR